MLVVYSSPLIDLGQTSVHLVGQDERDAIVLRIKLSRAQLTRRLAHLPRCLIGMEACAGAQWFEGQEARLKARLPGRRCAWPGRDR